jgi:hypothetical protein
MVDEPGQVATLCGVNNRVLIDSKHVATADALGIVALFAMISNRLSDHLAHILDHKLFGSYLLDGEQTPVVDMRFAELEWFLAQLELTELENFVDVVGGEQSTLL